MKTLVFALALMLVSAALASVSYAQPKQQVAMAAAADVATVAATPKSMVIDVIVAYTKKAASYFDDIKDDLVPLAIEEANEAFRVSNLGHIKLQVVHAYQTDYVEDGTHVDHVRRLADKSDGYMDEVHGLREKYRADVGLLVVDDPKNCGLAMQGRASADQAFAVVHHECAAARLTVANVIGQLIGARPELRIPPSNQPAIRLTN
jgi:hypothetical protein